MSYTILYILFPFKKGRAVCVLNSGSPLPPLPVLGTRCQLGTPGRHQASHKHRQKVVGCSHWKCDRWVCPVGCSRSYKIRTYSKANPKKSLYFCVKPGTLDPCVATGDTQKAPSGARMIAATSSLCIQTHPTHPACPSSVLLTTSTY